MQNAPQPPQPPEHVILHPKVTHAAVTSANALSQEDYFVTQSTMTLLKVIKNRQLEALQMHMLCVSLSSIFAQFSVAFQRKINMYGTSNT